MTEERKLGSIQPNTMGQATRIGGVSPSDINVFVNLPGQMMKVKKYPICNGVRFAHKMLCKRPYN